MGANQSCQPRGQEKVFSKSEHCVEIRRDDLGQEEHEILSTFAEKVKDVGGNKSPEEMLQMLQKELGQCISEEGWMGQAYIRIGIVGSTGAGKSTIINSFRGLRATDEGAARVGTTETTITAAMYRHPNHDHIILVDFPGALFKLKGGKWQRDTFDMKEYTRKFGEEMKECNVFLVFTSGRVHDNAVWIAAKAKEMKKKVLFVRSKFDQDVTNMTEDGFFAKGQEGEKGEKRLLEIHRKDFVDKLETLGYGRVDIGDVFVISGRLKHIEDGRWDAPALKQAILKQLDIQQKMLLMTITTDYSPTMVRAKAEIYRSRAWKVALGVAAGGVIPLAGTLVNAGAMLTTIVWFKNGFGLSSVGKLAVLTGKTEGRLQRFVDDRLSNVNKIIQFLSGEIDLQTLKQGLQALATAGSVSLNILMTAIAVDATVDVAVPVVGGLMTAPISFGLSWEILYFVIDEYERCALALHELAFR